MRKSLVIGILLIVTLLAGSACVGEVGEVDEQHTGEESEASTIDDAATEAQLATDELDFQILSEADLEELSQEAASSRAGCSNQQIRVSQNACKRYVCGSRGSYGIHSCDYRPSQGVVYAHCDCKTGADRWIAWW